MPKPDANAPASNPPLAPAIMVGPFALDQSAIMGLPIDGYAKNGVILVNHRGKCTIMHGDRPVQYTLSLYVQREALTDEESAAVTKQAADRDAAKKSRDLAEQEKREREIRRAHELGQESVVSAMRNINALAGALNTIKAVSGPAQH